MLESEKEKNTRGWSKLLNKEFNNLSSSLHISVIISRKVR
jgi:hypothetical protein